MTLELERPAGTPARRLPVGAEVQPQGVHFRILAPACARLSVVLEDGPGHGVERALTSEGRGWFSLLVPEADVGTLYRYRLGDGELVADPASRFQPDGPHGPSRVVDPDGYAWRVRDWRGAALRGQVVYELHVGTFTPEGTLAAAAEKLPHLAELGVTMLELMPLNDFCGRFGWGYDGVSWFAPTRLYGEPDDLRRFVDRAHELGLAVVLDVVYNHFGPDGNVLRRLGECYVRGGTEWGDGPAWDGEGCEGVRSFVLASVRHWVSEYRLDGLRIDATQAFTDRSPVHVLEEICATARHAARWPVVILGESEPQESWLLDHADGLWNDDFHHSARVALTGRCEAYYSQTQGTPQELLGALRWGFLYQGQHYAWQGRSRGAYALDRPGPAFVHFLENHDQVANAARGRRLHQLTSPGRYRAMTALLLLGPQTPMLFQGQEFASSRPWTYFADHSGELGRLVREGRHDFLRQFPSIADSEAFDALPVPGDPGVFEGCKLDWREREAHTEAVALHRDLLRLRREDPTFRAQRKDRLDGAVLGPESLVLRFFGDTPSVDRLLVLNLGRDLWLRALPEPLMAPVPGSAGWRVAWSSEQLAYGGSGTPEVDTGEGWRVPGHCAVVLVPREGEHA